MYKLEKLNDRICELNELVHTYEHQLSKEWGDSKKARQIHEKILKM